MNNEEIINYLSKYEIFGTAQIQRHFIWGYNRAIAKVIELVDLGLIHEIENKPYSFKISDSNYEPPTQSFLATLEKRSYDSYEFKEQLRIWFECISDDIKSNQQSRSNTFNCIKAILDKNPDSFITIINTSKINSLKLKSLNKNREIKLLLNHHILRKNRTSIVILSLEKPNSDIKQFRQLLNKNNIRNYAIEKMYVIGNKTTLNQCEKFINNKYSHWTSATAKFDVRFLNKN